MLWRSYRPHSLVLAAVFIVVLVCANVSVAGDTKGTPEPTAKSAIAVPATPQSANIFAYPADYYAVQIVAVKSKSQLMVLLDQYDLGDPPYGRMRTSTGLWYVLLLGVYPDYEAAVAAKETLPSGLLELNPWIRKMGPLQSAIKSAFPNP